MMKDAVVIAETHIGRIDDAALSLLGQDLACVEYFGDEHRPLSRRSRSQKVEVLPDRAAHRTWNTHIVLEPRPASRDRFLDQVFDDRTALRPEKAAVILLTEFVMTSRIADDQSAEPTVPDQDIGTQDRKSTRLNSSHPSI